MSFQGFFGRRHPAQSPRLRGSPSPTSVTPTIRATKCRRKSRNVPRFRGDRGHVPAVPVQTQETRARDTHGTFQGLAFSSGSCPAFTTTPSSSITSVPAPEAPFLPDSENQNPWHRSPISSRPTSGPPALPLFLTQKGHVLCSRHRLRRDSCRNRQAFPAADFRGSARRSGVRFQRTKAFDSRKEAAGDGVSGITATLAQVSLRVRATRNQVGSRDFRNIEPTTRMMR